MNDVGVVLPVHNQEEIIQDVLRGIIKNMSENVKEIVIVLDGCTDGTESKIDKVLPEIGFPIKIIFTDNFWEVATTNIGLKNLQTSYAVTLRDNMIITEKDFDKRLMKPFFVRNNILAVSAGKAQDEIIWKYGLHCYNIADNQSDPNTFFVRDAILRGVIMWDMQKMQELNYLDESFSPISYDDEDISFRAYQKGYVVGHYNCEYEEKMEFDRVIKTNSLEKYSQATRKNMQLFMQRHYDQLVGEKHAEDVILE